MSQIVLTTAYRTTDGQTWPTLELAQARELELLLKGALLTLPADLALSTTALLVKKKGEVIEILTGKPSNGTEAKPRQQNRGDLTANVIEMEANAAR